MDLVYADENKKDIGILNSYSFDMAFGNDENDFECVIDRKDHCCKEGYYFYVENEEFGGIIDRIKVSTANEEITYSGRTWHGVLENKIIIPDKGQDYAEFEGEANTVLRDIIERLNLNNLFEVLSIDSGIEILPYQMERYVAGYTGIRKMLRENDAKLKMYWHHGKVMLQAVNRYDYSQDEEFNTSQVEFEISRNFKPVNHLICLGKGDMQQRAVIHLFTDENGGIQPYTLCSNPVKDKDYILDESSKILFEENEITDTYECNADITTNYLPLLTEPKDWNSNCEAYFYRAETEAVSDDTEIEYDYKSVERESIDVYSLQKYAPVDWNTNYSEYFVETDEDKFSSVTSTEKYIVQTKKPSDWKANYDDYFVKSGSDYKAVEGVVIEKYSKQSKKPSDWKKRYAEYYVFYSDGVVSEYQSVSGISKNKYVKQTRKPTDWSDNYKSYYKKKKTGGYESLEHTGTPVFKSNKYYKKSSNGKYELLKKKPSDWKTSYSNYYYKKNSGYHKVESTGAPTWKKNRYYTQQSYSVAPKWQKGKYFTKSEKVNTPVWADSKYYTKINDAPPTWSKNKYYTKTTKTPAPAFVKNTYYYASEDRYAVLAQEGISKLEELWKSEELSIDLAETDQSYDIDDIVGAVENVTGIEAIQSVTKKIIKITNDDITITYEVN